MRGGLPEAVLFDLDGTLADTAPDLAAAVNALRREEGLEPVPLAALRPHASRGTRGMLHGAFGVSPQHPDYPALSERFLALYAARLCVGTRLFAGMAPLLEALETASIKWGIVTNKLRYLTEPLVAALGLGSRACCVISGDSAVRPKPAPDLLLLASERAGVTPARCIYVGDDLRDMQAGRAAGMGTIAAAWGYLGEDVPIDAWGADAIIARPDELIGLLGLGAGRVAILKWRRPSPHGEHLTGADLASTWVAKQRSAYRGPVPS